MDWPKGKKDTPFGLLPLITHYKPDGSTFTLSQVTSILRYTARLFGLVGANDEENAIIDSCVQCATEDILNTFQKHVWMKKDSTKEDTAKAFEEMTSYFDGIERFLVKNGSNGYLVGSKVWLTDYQLLFTISPGSFLSIASF